MPDPFIALPTEVSLKALSFLSPRTLVYISIVSKLWYALTNCPDPWRSVTPISDIQATADEMKGLSAEYSRERLHRITTKDAFQASFVEFPPSTEVTLDAAARSAKLGLGKQFANCCHNPKLFFIQMTTFIRRIVSPLPAEYLSDYHAGEYHAMRNLLQHGLAASTTDEYDFQDIGQTLSAHAFWSSTGSRTGDVDDVKSREWLCYRMEADMCVIKWIEITPYMVGVMDD
ncbi:hypothetical protein BC937DRAFT_88435 [Endogone sp. FLAS-F59071]|nr:hypothetical protein BC937DRAFT_88435 [Endogone sp. FLAS-F59071]|eukprot:RUS18699.1 hypothetical protein BC937DRAFT_88435 [Endogone sp. FLAS-F59071]